MVLYVSCYVRARHLHGLGSNEIALHLTVEPMSHELKHNIGVAVDTRALSLLDKCLKDFLYIGHIEIATKTKILGTPVVASEKRVDIRKATLSGS